MHPVVIPIVMPMVLATLVAGERALVRLVARRSVTHELYGLAFLVVPFVGYLAMQQRAGLFEWSARNPLHWLAAWGVLELMTFGRRWVAPRIAALWATHAGDRAQQEGNAAVALRVATFQATVLVIMPLAVLGAPIWMAIIAFTFTNYAGSQALLGR